MRAQRVAQATEQQLSDALAQNTQLQSELAEVRALHVSGICVYTRRASADASLMRTHGWAALGPGVSQDTQRLQTESNQGQTQADFAEFEKVIAGLAAEKLEMEATVCELMLRLEAAAKHTQALADERTFLQVRARSTAVCCDMRPHSVLCAAATTNAF